MDSSAHKEATQRANRALEDLLYRYNKASKVPYDEMLNPGGEHLIRDHWVPLMRSLSHSSQSDLEHKSHEARRVMRESGVTYNVYEAPEGQSRAWQIDPVPLVLNQEDWRTIESGLRQRARLLNLIFKDLYGQQKLLKERLLPAELVFAHKGFQRSCEGLYGRYEQPLFQYAADLARGPDGNMWILSDRTQAPSGAGYALETRISMSRVMATDFRANMVRRLSQYFRTFRASLAKMAPFAKEDPNIVLLTPGPLNETYFEHAYLASYLGYTLVQGADLTVRDGKVWLKSIDGLRQVDIILRRMDDSFCDPLELREDSYLGIPGLVQAARDGQVTIVNPLGSGIIESPGLYPFLSGIAKKWMGEDLQMDCAATWWCGHEKEREHVIDQLDQLVIKSIDRRFRTVYGGQLSLNERNSLIDNIRANPHLYVGQERMACSSTPSLVDGTILPRRVLLRSFLISSDNDYMAMPGGLTRIASDQDDFLISNQSGGASKDTWVITDQPDRQRSLLAEYSELMKQIESDVLLPSRSAENLYWVGRYAERSEGLIRLLRTTLRKMTDVDEYHDEVDKACLTRLIHALRQLSEIFDTPSDEPNTPATTLLEIAFDRSYPGSMLSNLNSLFYGAFNVRDLWSADTWRILDDIGELINEPKTSKPSITSLDKQIDRLIDILMAFSGLTTESMSHETGWFMFDLGKRLERALQLIKIIRSLLVDYDSQMDEQLNIESLMASQESLMTYRRRYRLSSSAAAAIYLLVLDDHHPRSLSYQIAKLQSHCQNLPRQVRRAINPPLNKEEKTILSLRTTLQLADPAELARIHGETSKRESLIELLSQIEASLLQVSEDISHRYFSHTGYVTQNINTQLKSDIVAANESMAGNQEP